MPSNAFIETLTTHYVIIMDKALHSIFYKLQVPPLPSIPAVTDVLQATVIFAWISVKASQQLLGSYL